MEPNIPLIGRGLDSLEILRDELIKFDRKIVIANSEEGIASQIRQEKIDLVIIGAGLQDEVIESMKTLIHNLNQDLEVHVMEKTPGINPTHMIGYTNEKAVMWKLIKSRK